jgi:hypothetical protein
MFVAAARLPCRVEGRARAKRNNTGDCQPAACGRRTLEDAMGATRIAAVSLLILAALPVRAQESPDAALAALQAWVPGVQVIALPATGDLRLTPQQALTVDSLRGVALDGNPPVAGTPNPPYPEGQTDGLPAGTGPYAAPGIAPFRLKHFTAEFSYGGWHNLDMMQYATTHGFSVLYPYVMPDTKHLPAGTQLLKWGSFVDWNRFMTDHALAAGRWDLLAEMDVATEVLRSSPVWDHPPDTLGMLDLEHGNPLSPDQLRSQDWYPGDAPEAERTAFEGRYYRGYLETYTVPLELLRRKNWTSAGVYPQPYGSGWYALLGRAERGEPGTPDPATDWAWQRYGRAMALAQDVLYPDIYVYYWSAQNVAYTLARMDYDRALLDALPVHKPYRPYFWPLLHGGDTSYRWWNQQPLPTEDERAIFALTFFAGCDGVVLWNWSEFDNHHVAPVLWRDQQTTAVGILGVKGGTGADVMVGRDFQARREGAPADAPPDTLRRYDVLAVQSLDDAAGTVTFQRIDTSHNQPSAHSSPDWPVYTLPREELTGYLRAASEPVAGAVEGLALVAALEPILYRGAPRVDVPALEQFAKSLPIVRRVQWGPLHLLASYDPGCVVGRGAPREVTLEGFAGHAGLTLTVPADGQLRVFVLREG